MDNQRASLAGAQAATRWNKARERFEKARERLQARQDGEAEDASLDHLMDEYARAKEFLLGCPAPGLQALIDKLEIMAEHDLDPRGVAMRILIEDARKLAETKTGIRFPDIDHSDED